MSDPARKRATYQDVIDAPEHYIAEILNGELVLQPRPGGRHQSVVTALSVELGSLFGSGRSSPGGWIIVYEPELHLGEDVLVPDLAAWRRERMSHVGAEAFFTLRPDWVCETLSPSTEKRDRGVKLGIYGREAVPNVWLVHPVRRTVEVLRLVSEKWLVLGVHADEEKVRAEPFDAVELDLSALWADLGPVEG